MCAERCKHGSEGGGRKRASYGTSSAPYLTQNLAVCTSPIFLFFYFPLVKYMELLGEWRTDLPVFSEHGGRCLESLVKTRCVCLVREARTRAGNRKTRDDSDPITLLRRTCLTHPLLNTLYSAYAARR